MKLRGKDYCNCEHAQLLRDALLDTRDALQRGNPIEAAGFIRRALDTDSAARIELWGNEPTENKRKVS